MDLTNNNQNSKSINDARLDELQENIKIIDLNDDSGGYYDWVYLYSYEGRGYIEFWTPRVGASALAALAGYKGTPQGALLSFFLNMLVMFSTLEATVAYTTVFMYEAKYGSGKRQSTYYWINSNRTQPAGNPHWHERFY